MIEIVVVTPPMGEIIALDEVKAHLRVDQDFDDLLIAAQVAAAAAHIAEVLCWRTLQPTELQATFDCWDGREVWLPMPPVTSLTSVELVDENEFPDVVTDVDLDWCRLDVGLGRVRMYGHAVGGNGAAGRLRIVYTAGYATLPTWARQAILLLTGHYYENREAVVVGAGVSAMEIPQAVMDLCQAHMAWRPGGAV